jgi:hypothetical protein
VEIKILGSVWVRIKNNGWVGWFHPVEWSKLMGKLGVFRPEKHPITTHLFPYSNIIDTVRLPLISGEKTHSWGKIAV